MRGTEAGTGARERLRRWSASWRTAQIVDLVLLPCLTGALTGAATIGFVELLRAVQWLAIGSTALPLHVLPHVAWYRALLAPACGGLLVGPLIYFLAPEAQGHGVPEVIEAVMVGGGRIRRRVAAVKSLASALTIGSGGSVGREGPIVQIGAAVGSAFGQSLRLSAAQLRTLAACGAAGGIAAVFNAPMAGAFFALEVITGNFAMPAFGPVILSSVVATVVSRAYFGNYPAFIVQPYQLEHLLEIGLYAVLAVACGAVAAAFIRTMDAFEWVAAHSRVPRIWQPALGGLLIGALIVVVPNVYGVGYATMDAALKGSLPWTWLALLIPVKILATCVTLASGGSGGVFLPSLYIGAVTGGLFGTMAHGLLPGATAGSGAYALVGMAGVLSAATHSPITAVLLLFEVTGDYQIILPVMVVSILANLVGRTLSPESLYSLSLTRRGIALHRREDIIMRSHTVRSVMRTPGAVLSDRMPIAQVVEYFLQHEVVSAYVTATDGRFVGAIFIHDIKDPEARELGPLVVARDIAELNEQALRPDDTLAACMDRFLLSDHDELPVIDADRRLIGVVSRRDVLRVYSTELLRHEYLGVRPGGPSLQRLARSVRLTPALTLARVTTPSWVAGRSLRDANLRATHNLTVVAVQRGGEGEDQLPDPEVPLAPGDVLLVVGRPADIAEFRWPTAHPAARSGEIAT
jgi:CIC family chloride channel protein